MNLVTVRMKTNGLACWHLVDVLPAKLPLLKRMHSGAAIDVAELGRILDSGWGIPPTERINDDV